MMRNVKKALSLGGLILGIAAVIGTGTAFVRASDHDDGESEIKGRNLNLTDLYAFREVDQNPAAPPQNLVLIMNTNPRSVAGQQYYFSTRARYEFQVARVTNNDATPTGIPDVTLRFEFDDPTASMQQDYTLTVIRNGTTNVV
ncbi:MAG: DUF4331 family protein [Elainellaceae cyanobacterium]